MMEKPVRLSDYSDFDRGYWGELGFETGHIGEIWQKRRVDQRKDVSMLANGGLGLVRLKQLCLRVSMNPSFRYFPAQIIRSSVVERKTG
jgi:hypothetical protein